MTNRSSVLKKIKKREERRLIDEALAGSEVAFARLYSRYHAQVYSFCSRLLRGKFDVEDAVQTVFLEAWRSMSRFEGRSLFSTWLTKIAIHTCLSFHRKGSKVMLVGADESDQYEQPKDLLWGQKQVQPEKEIFLTERKDLITKLLLRMTEKKMLVIMMADMQGMTAPEISRVLNIPDATVRTRLFHARKEFACWVSKNKSYRDVLFSAGL